MAKKTKQVQFSYSIQAADRDRKMRQIAAFLDKGHDVKLIWKLKGREALHMDHAKESVDYITSFLLKQNPKNRVSSVNSDGRLITLIIVRAR